MFAKTIENKKQLMAALLTRETFDFFETVSGSVTTFAEFSVDGQYHERFYQDDPEADAPSREAGAPGREAGAPGREAGVLSREAGTPGREYAPWSLLRPFFLSVIRGKNTPLSFQFVFRLPAEEMNALIAEEAIAAEAVTDVSGLLLNLSFDGTSILLTTGVSHKTFSMDRTLERAWDRYVEQRFSDYFD